MKSVRVHRLVPRCKTAQKQMLAHCAGQARWPLWNHALDRQQARHARGEKYAAHSNLAKWLTAWRNAPCAAWLAEVAVTAPTEYLRGFWPTGPPFWSGKACSNPVTQCLAKRPIPIHGTN